MGIAPDKNGRVPDSDVARLREFGDAVRAKFAHPLLSENVWTSTAGYRAPVAGADGAAWTSSAAHDGVLDVSFKKPVTFNCAMTTEWLVDGSTSAATRSRWSAEEVGGGCERAGNWAQEDR